MRRLVPRRAAGVLGGIGLLAMIGLALALLPTSAGAAPKPGQVTTSDDQTFEGEIDETATPGRVDITVKGIKTSIDRRNVKQVVYFNTPKQEFDAKMAKLARDDLAGRIALGRWALERKEYDLALAALDSAKAIDPKSREVTDLQSKITAARPSAATTTTAPAAPAMTGNNPPAAATRPASGTKTAKRLVTPDEMNAIRQAEWVAGDRTVKVKLDPNVRQAFINSGVIPIPQARQMQPTEIAWEILTTGTDQQKKGVQIANDPAPLFDFKRTINPILINGCATASCHSSEKPGATKLVFFPARTDDLATYTNFVILQQFSRSHDGVEYLMIDRTRKDASLLAQYMLPPAIARTPHPEVAAYKGTVKSPAQPNYQLVIDWVGRTLAPVAPDYTGIDLTAPPKPDGKGPRPPAAPGAPVPPVAPPAGATPL